MIDQDILKRDARADIEDWPVLIRHYYTDTLYVEVTAALNAEENLSVLDEGGLVDDARVGILAIADDFTEGMPKCRQRVDVEQADGSWKRLEVKRTPDYYDPLGPTVQFSLGSPDN